jgi:hypothetical protein
MSCIFIIECVGCKQKRLVRIDQSFMLNFSKNAMILYTYQFKI